MITQTNRRIHSGEECLPLIFPKTLDQALESLLIYEIGYGGQVVELEPTKVVTKTHVLSCVDFTEFVGSVEEMQPLVATAALCVKHDVRRNNASFDAAAEAVMNVTQGNPLLIHLGGDYILGQYSLQNILAAVLGFEPQLNDLSMLSKKDALAAMILAYEGSCSIDEAIQLAKGN